MKIIFLSLFFLLSVNTAFSQYQTLPPARGGENNSSFSNRLFTGGDFGLQFGAVTYIDIAPILGYRLTDKFSAGIGAKYIYYSVDESYGLPKYSTNIYGGIIFARYNIIDPVFLHAEFETLSLETYVGRELERRPVSALFLGAGYRQFIGESSSINLMLLYDVIQDLYSPYHNPLIIKVGFDFGL